MSRALFSLNKIKNISRVLIRILVVCSFTSIAIVATADDQSIPNLSSSSQLKIDGVINESQWQSALKVELKYEIAPAENDLAKVKTEAFIFEDGEYLYIAFDAKDPNPELVRAYLSPRDRLNQSDYIQISLDTFNDSSRAYRFQVNPLGIQADAIIDEITGRIDSGWDAIWQSAGNRTSTGYQVEIKIPFKSLRFKDSTQLKTWGIQFSRTWHRDVTYVFSDSLKNRNYGCNLCQYAKFKGLKDSQPTNNLTIIPSLTVSQTDDKKGGEWQAGNIDDRESLDIRWGITKNAFLNATINPDFSQIEADEIRLDANAPFAILIPEKRTFFLDGADYFSNWSRLVYTRLFEEPEYGAKITGKNGAHSYGIMSIEDRGTRFLIPGNQGSRLVQLDGAQSQNQMFRYRYDFGDSSSMGTTYTQREALNGEYQNQMLSFDGNYRLTPSDSVKFQYLSSQSEYPDEVVEQYSQKPNLSGKAISANYTHIGSEWDWIFTYHRFGEDFRADSGFVSKSNWEQRAFLLNRHWFPEDQKQWWKKVTMTLQWNRTADLFDLKLGEDRAIQLAVEGIYQSTIGVWTGNLDEFYVDQMFNKQSYEVFALFTPFAGIDLEFNVSWGDEIDYSTVELGKVKTVISTVGYQINRNWRLSIEHVNQELKNSFSRVYDVSFYNTRLSYQLDIRSFFRLTFQGETDQLGAKTDYNNVKDLSTQLLYSYQVNPFTLLYLGYSDHRFKTIDLNHLQRDKRSVFMKFSYAWQI